MDITERPVAAEQAKIAYSAKNLSVLAYANGFTLWHYVAEHQVSDLMQPGYFSGACDMLRRGDQVFVSGVEAATLVVTHARHQSGRVTVALLTQVVRFGGE